MIEGRAAGDGFAARAGDVEHAGQGERGTVAVIGAGLRVVKNRAAGTFVPGDALVGRGAGEDGVGRERRAVGFAQEKRAVGPRLEKIAIDIAALDQQIGEAEGKRAVAPGAHAEPGIRLVGEALAARIDDDQLGAARLRLCHPPGIGEPGGARIVAPEENAVGIGEIRHRRADAIGQGIDIVAVEIADLGAEHRVGAAEGVAQALDPEIGILQAGARRRGDAEGDTLRPFSLGDIVELGGNGIERLVPADALPARVRLALGPGAAQRMKETVGMMRAALTAKRLAGGVFGVGLDGNEPAVLNHRNATASRGAERAIARHAPRRIRIRHRLFLPPGVCPRVAGVSRPRREAQAAAVSPALSFVRILASM